MDTVTEPNSPEAGNTPAENYAVTRPEAYAVDQIVLAWIDERIRNSPVARSIEAWNHLMAETGDLIARLKAHIAPEFCQPNPAAPTTDTHEETL